MLEAFLKAYQRPVFKVFLHPKLYLHTREHIKTIILTLKFIQQILEISMPKQYAWNWGLNEENWT